MATMKDNQHVKPVIDLEGNRVLFHVKGYQQPLVLDMNKVSAEVAKRAALAGMAQVRIVDKAAVGMLDEEGDVIPEDERIEMKHDRMAELIAHYETGTTEWALKGAGGGGKSITVEAIAEIKGVSYEEAEEYVKAFAAKKLTIGGKAFSFDGDTKAALAYLRKGGEISKKILEIRGRRQAAPKLDADEALAELGKVA